MLSVSGLVGTSGAIILIEQQQTYVRSDEHKTFKSLSWFAMVLSKIRKDQYCPVKSFEIGRGLWSFILKILVLE